MPAFAKPSCFAAPALLAASLLAGCASPGSVLGRYQLQTALSLQGHCRQVGLAPESTAGADSLLLAARRHLEDDGSEAAYWSADLAVSGYRLALFRRQADAAKARVDALRRALAEEAEQLESLREVYDEIKTLKRQ